MYRLYIVLFIGTAMLLSFKFGNWYTKGYVDKDFAIASQQDYKIAKDQNQSLTDSIQIVKTDLRSLKKHIENKNPKDSTWFWVNSKILTYKNDVKKKKFKI